MPWMPMVFLFISGYFFQGPVNGDSSVCHLRLAIDWTETCKLSCRQHDQSIWNEPRFVIKHYFRQIGAPLIPEQLSATLSIPQHPFAIDTAIDKEKDVLVSDSAVIEFRSV